MEVGILTFDCHMYIMSILHCNHYKQFCLHSVCSGLHWLYVIMYMWQPNVWMATSIQQGILHICLVKSQNGHFHPTGHFALLPHIWGQSISSKQAFWVRIQDGHFHPTDSLCTSSPYGHFQPTVYLYKLETSKFQNASAEVSEFSKFGPVWAQNAFNLATSIHWPT